MFVGPKSVAGTLKLLKRHIEALRQFRKRLRAHKLIVTQVDQGTAVVLILILTNGRSVVSLQNSFSYITKITYRHLSKIIITSFPE